MKVVHLKTQKTLIDDLRVAKNSLTRIKGLLFSKPLRKGEGLWLVPCNSVHTIGMTYPLDLVFLNRKKCVVHVIKGLKPHRVSPIVFHAWSVIEMNAGTLDDFQLADGDELRVE